MNYKELFAQVFPDRPVDEADLAVDDVVEFFKDFETLIENHLRLEFVPDEFKIVTLARALESGTAALDTFMKEATARSRAIRRRLRDGFH